jgi:hypothetical protein
LLPYFDVTRIIQTTLFLSAKRLSGGAMDIFLTGLAGAASASEAAAQSSRISQANEATLLVKTEVTELREHVERLALLNQSLWELLRDKLRVTDADLEKKIQEVDLRDGMADGKMSRHPLRCPQCGRISNSRHKKCLYCSLEFQSDIFG